MRRLGSLALLLFVLLALNSCLAPFGSELNGADTDTMDAGVDLDAGTIDTPPPLLNVALPSRSAREAFASCSGCAQYDGYLNRRFPMVREIVRAIAQNNDHVFLGGDFARVGYNVRGLVAYNTDDSSIDFNWPDVANNEVRVAISDGAGGLFVGGDFTEIGGQNRAGLARIDANGALSPWVPAGGLGAGKVSSLVIHNGWLYVGGEFAFDGFTNLVAFNTADGTRNPLFKPQPNDKVRALAVANDLLYVGGDFTEIGIETRSKLAALDLPEGAVNTVFSPPPITMAGGLANAHVLLVEGNHLYLGGVFDAVDSNSSHANLARFDLVTGALDSWAASPGDAVMSLAVGGSRLYVGGEMLKVVFYDLSSANPDDEDSLNVTFNGVIHTMSVSNNLLYVGGNFTQATDSNQIHRRGKVVAINVGTKLVEGWEGNVGGEFDTTASGTVFTLLAVSSKLFVGGSFEFANIAYRNKLAAIEKATGKISSWRPNIDGISSSVRALIFDNNTLFVGGDFGQAEGTTANQYLVAYDVTSPLSSVTTKILGTPPATAQPNQPVSALATIPGLRLFIGGAFTSVGALSRAGLASFNISSNPFALEGWNPSHQLAAAPLALAVMNDNLFVGGEFNLLASSWTRRCLAAFFINSNDLAGTPLSNFMNCSDVSDRVNALHVSNGRLYAGGKFNSLGNQPRMNLAFFTGYSFPDPAFIFNTNAEVFSLASDSTRLYIGGKFSSISAQPREQLAAVTIPPAPYALDSWAPSVDGTGAIRAIAAFPEHVVVGGDFIGVDNSRAVNLAALLPAASGCQCLLPECDVNTDCNDGNPCTDDSCDDGTCVSAPNLVCSPCTNATVMMDCPTPAEPCIQLSCLNGECTYDASGCVGCLANSDCSDADPCTANVCNAGTCHFPLNYDCGGIQLSAGFDHNCMLDTDGKIQCWGNDFDDSGLPGKVSNRPTASGYRQVSAGRNASCALTGGGAIECWGILPAAAPPGLGYRQISVGGNHACAVTSNNIVQCWGSAAFASSQNFFQVSAGAQHTCAIDFDGDVHCWGLTTNGQAPPLVAGPFKQVSAGQIHSCGLRTDGSISCWGGSIPGFPPHAVAVPPTGFNYTRISGGLGNFHSCAIKDDDLIECWGINNSDDSINDTPTSGTYRYVSAGDGHTCAVATNETIVCWGTNTLGQGHAAQCPINSDCTDTDECTDTFCAKGWDRVSMTTTMGARLFPAMAYDAARSQMLLFGGTDNRLWQWSGALWSPVTGSGLDLRTETAMVYDSARQRIVLFGGRNGAVRLGDTHEWDGTSWAKVSETGPSKRYLHAMAYDSARKRVVLYGGSTDDGASDETWEWNGAIWTQRAVSGPKKLQTHTMAYDAERGVTVLLGGTTDGSTAVDEMWEWDGTTWTGPITSTNALSDLNPAPRRTNAMAYDSARKVTMVFSGNTGSANPPQDTWQWDGTHWLQIETPIAPAGRHASAMAYDEKRGVTVLFGGTFGSDFLDTWEWHGAPGTCTSVDVCGTCPALCPAMEACWEGSCFPTCDEDDDCDDPQICFDGRCAVDACRDVNCQGTTSCYLGSCYDVCADDTNCIIGDNCYDASRCAPTACSGVQCQSGLECYEGTCFGNCSTDVDCDPDHFCYSGRCATSVCEGVQCQLGAQCYEGTCFGTCSEDPDCDPNHYCFEERCVLDACEFLECSAGSECYQGTCFGTCVDDVDCEEDHFCYSGRCAPNACEDVRCGNGTECYGGSCFETCEDDDDCADPLKCFNMRCSLSPCDGMQCAGQEVCHEGQCFEVCGEDDKCKPDHHCFLGFCTQDECDTPNKVACHPGQVCHQGSCFDQCLGAEPCKEPLLCFEGRCAANSCAAKLEDYDSEHVYRQMSGHYPTAFQRSTPWMRPRPVILGGTLANLASAIEGHISALIPPLAKGRGRVILFAHPESGRYAVVLMHGKNSGDQGPAGASYSIRYGEDTTAPLLRTYGAVTQILTNDDFQHHQVQIETNDSLGNVGGVALISLPADKPWNLYINAAFRGDVSRWEIYSAEANRWFELDMSEELTIKNVNITPDVVLSREVGVAACLAAESGAGRHGICSRGTVTNCKSGLLVCDQTVSPWDFEACDNRDNNCDGQVDEASAMRFPMVQLRHSGNANWQPWPTIDQSTAAPTFLNYTPHNTDAWEGSTAAMRLEDGSVGLQAANRSLLFFHRDLARGIVSMPMIHGARTSGAPAIATSKVEAQFEFQGELDAYYDFSDLMFVSWYDDWAPASETLKRDPVPKTAKYDEYKLEWSVRSWTSGGETQRESDSGVMQITWPHGGSLRPLRFDLDINLAADVGDWRIYAPYWVLRGMDASKKLEVRIEQVPAAETLCMSNTDFEGCRATNYVCRAGGVAFCPTPTDETCGGCRDHDGDGYPGFHKDLCPDGDDCDDTDAAVNPGAIEVCDGTDKNCDGVVDGLAAPACPNGQATCGPEMCEYRSACTCPTGPGSCFCSSALDDDESATNDPSTHLPAASAPASEQLLDPLAHEPSATAPGAACATAGGLTDTNPSGLPWIALVAACVGALIGRRRRVR